MSRIGLVEWPEELGCPTQTYSYTKRPSFYRMPALKGRPRYRLKDGFAPYKTRLNFAFVNQQFLLFQKFWAEDLDHGVHGFVLPLMLDDASFFNTGQELYEVHAVGPYQASVDNSHIWSVNFEVEVYTRFRTDFYQCPVIYGGPISAPAEDTVYGGPIDNLATDVIVPCEAVDPNG